MAKVVPINDANAPEISFYKDLTSENRRASEMRGKLPYFIAEGQLVTEKLIGSRFKLQSLLLTPERLALMEHHVHLLEAPVYVVDTPTMHAIAGFEFHRGVLACGVRPEHAQSLAVAKRSRIVVMLEHVSNPDNVGGILRSIAAIAGEDASLILGPGCADPLYRKSIRVSMGHVFRVPWAIVDDLSALVADMASRGAQILATTPDVGAESVRALNGIGGGNVVLLMGAEGPGLSPNLIRTACRRIRIPMRQGVDSLNVGVAAAVILDRVVEALEC